MRQLYLKIKLSIIIIIIIYLFSVNKCNQFFIDLIKLPANIKICWRRCWGQVIDWWKKSNKLFETRKWKRKLVYLLKFFGETANDSISWLNSLKIHFMVKLQLWLIKHLRCSTVHIPKKVKNHVSFLISNYPPKISCKNYRIKSALGSIHQRAIWQKIN